MVKRGGDDIATILTFYGITVGGLFSVGGVLDKSVVCGMTNRALMCVAVLLLVREALGLEDMLCKLAIGVRADVANSLLYTGSGAADTARSVGLGVTALEGAATPMLATDGGVLLRPLVHEIARKELIGEGGIVARGGSALLAREPICNLLFTISRVLDVFFVLHLYIARVLALVGIL